LIERKHACSTFYAPPAKRSHVSHFSANMHIPWLTYTQIDALGRVLSWSAARYSASQVGDIECMRSWFPCTINNQ